MPLMTAQTLYRDVVLDHCRHPRNRGALAHCTHAADGVNPLCGDSLRVEVDCAGGRVEHMGFFGEACAITTAAASMLSELVIGRDAHEIAALGVPLEQLISGEIESAPSLGALNAFSELKRHPSRRKCAALPLATLRAALAGEVRATTETP